MIRKNKEKYGKSVKYTEKYVENTEKILRKYVENTEKSVKYTEKYLDNTEKNTSKIS